MFVVEGVIDKSFSRKLTTTGVSRMSLPMSYDTYLYELLIGGKTIRMDMNDKEPSLNRGQRVIVAGFGRRNLQGYAYKNLNTGETGASGGGAIAGWIGLILLAAVAGIVYLYFGTTMTVGDWIFAILVSAILLNLANHMAGTILRAWLAARAIDVHERRSVARQAS